MITRIVKMVFAPEKVARFEAMFAERKEKIRNQPGCSHLQLCRENGKTNVYFTCSHWDDVAALDNYRHTDFFAETWALAKACFADKPEAWTLEALVKLD
ncbi:MAG: antibiotic biosynthesis monooxygenase family protein [Edaphocola sp.]